MRKPFLKVLLSCYARLMCLANRASFDRILPQKGRGLPILGPERVVCIDREVEKDTEQVLSAVIMPFIFGGINTQAPALLAAGNCKVSTIQEKTVVSLLTHGFRHDEREVSGVPCKVYCQESPILRQEEISRPKSGDMASWVYEGRTSIVPVELLKGTDTRFQAGHYDSRRPAGTSCLSHTHVTINWFSPSSCWLRQKHSGQTSHKRSRVGVYFPVGGDIVPCVDRDGGVEFRGPRGGCDMNK
jgi:hypothetical protein